MGVDVDVQQTFRSGGHDFGLNIRFNCDEDITVLFGQSGAVIAGLYFLNLEVYYQDP